MRLPFPPLAVAAAVLVASACQTYDFEPVQPLALAQSTTKSTVISRKAKPNIMLVVDKSGSMNGPVSSGGTRLTNMQSAMQTFLGQYGNTARLGLAVFPNTATSTGCSDACTPGKVITAITTSNDVDSELKAQATAINGTIQSIGSGSLPAIGGTPTANTLNAIGQEPLLQDPNRDNFVLLLTDGLPNCDTRPVSMGGPDATTCTCVPGSQCTTSGGGSTPCNCLDQNRAVQAVTALRQKNIKTIVVGFGDETGQAGTARSVLNAMAEAGDFARKCETDADCGNGDTCDAMKLCGTRFYQAGNSAELAAALAKIGKLTGNDNPCEWKLSSAPSDPNLLAVYVGQNGADPTKIDPSPTTWSFDPAKTAVVFTGDICTALENATPTSPVKVEIRLVQPL